MQRDGSGSDHGGRAGIATIFTDIKSDLAQIIGELVEVGDTTGTWVGHWGQNASGYEDEDVFNFIEYILGVPSTQRAFPDKNKVIEDNKEIIRILKEKEEEEGES